jgi:predicted DNA binding CopG/RHH family protein
MKKIEHPIFDLDEGEQALSDSFDRGEWKSVNNLAHEIAVAKKAAENYFHEKEKVTVRIQAADMARIRQISAEKGLKPHAYITSIVHQVVAGHIEV